MNSEEKKISSSRVFEGRVVKLDVDRVSLADGSTSLRECIRHTGGAAMLFIKDGKVALVRQFRYLYGEYTLEIPAGKLEKGEDPALAAAREMEEETGYRAEEVRHLLDIYPTPGYTDEVIHIYFCDSASFVGQRLDSGEFLDCCFTDLDEVVKMIKDGQIKDSKTVCAVLYFLSDK